MAVNINLSRSHLAESWGFRLAGGCDYGQQLSVKKVQPNSPAEIGHLDAGDAILGIAGNSTSQLTHGQATHLIKNSGNFLQLTLLKHALTAPNDIRPKGPLKFSPWSN